MSLESFFGLDDSESQGGTEASEQFQERMRKNARHIKAMSKNQKKKKAQEDKLAALLIKFIQDPAKADIVFLVVRLLQEEVPAPFVLALLSIGEPELEKELIEHYRQEKERKKAEQAQIQGQAQLSGDGSSSLAKSEQNIEEVSGESAQNLITFGDQGLGSLPDSVKKKLNEWGRLILESGRIRPQKTIENVLTPEQKLKSLVLNLLEYSLEKFFKRNGLNLDASRNRQFALLSIQSVLIQLRDMANEQSDVERYEHTGDAQSSTQLTPQEPSSETN